MQDFGLKMKRTAGYSGEMVKVAASSFSAPQCIYFNVKQTPIVLVEQQPVAAAECYSKASALCLSSRISRVYPCTKANVLNVDLFYLKAYG